MNLHALKIGDVPIGAPLPWTIYDPLGYTVFEQGQVISDRATLARQFTNGLLRDMDALSDAPPGPIGADDASAFATPPLSDIFPPRGIKPQVGSRVQLRLLSRSTHAHYISRLIGYVTGKSILVTSPEQAGYRIEIYEGEQVEARMIIGGSIAVFHSVIQRLCASPVHYVHMAYPAGVRCQRLRRSPWAQVDLRATVKQAQRPGEIARIINLSPEGAQLQASATFGSKGDAIQLNLHAAIDDLKASLDLAAIILRVSPPSPHWEEEEEFRKYGIAFVSVPPQESLWLRCLVYRRIAEGHPA